MSKMRFAIFGRIASGKSSIVSALSGVDIWHVEHEFGVKITPALYCDYSPKMTIVEIHCVVDKSEYSDVIMSEAQKAHGHVFVLEGEPTQDEIEIFDFVKKNTPHSPTIVFVNKADRFEHMPKSDVETVKGRIIEKMRKYVDSELDIIFGSARLFDKERDEMVRQNLPSLEDRLEKISKRFETRVVPPSPVP